MSEGFIHYSEAAEQRMNELSARYDRANEVYTFILQGRSHEFYIPKLEQVLPPEDYRVLQEVAGNRQQVMERLWKIIVDMTEDP